MKFTILICSLPERKEQLEILLRQIRMQHPVAPSILIDDRGREIPTGQKRNDLIERCETEYFCFVDDDDSISPDYVEKINAALFFNPDVVTFCGWMTTNGQHRVDWTIRLGENYEERNGHYYRWPNHLCVFRKALVHDIKFENIYHGEDYKWSVAVKNSGRIVTAAHIDHQLYHYDFKTHK